MLATNGDWIKEFLYFVQGPEGDIYYGTMGAGPTKTSIHASGAAHHRTGDHLIKLKTGPPLKDFKGIRQLFSMSIGKDVFANAHFGQPYSGEKRAGLSIIDTRSFHSDVSVMAFLVEPERAEELNRLFKFMKEPQVTIFARTAPWFVIATSDQITLSLSKPSGATAKLKDPSGYASLHSQHRRSLPD